MGNDYFLYDSLAHVKDGGYVLVGKISKLRAIFVLKLDSSGKPNSPCVQVLPGTPPSEFSVQITQRNLNVSVRDVTSTVINGTATVENFKPPELACD